MTPAVHAPHRMSLVPAASPTSHETWHTSGRSACQWAIGGLGVETCTDLALVAERDGRTLIVRLAGVCVYAGILVEREGLEPSTPAL
jgi:hypothetical protein